MLKEKITTYYLQIIAILKSNTIKSISFLLSANVGTSLLGFIGSVIVLRNLSNEGIALIYPLIGIMMIAAQFGELGISTAFIKLASSYYDHNRNLSMRFFNMALKSKSILALLVLLIGSILSPYISQMTFNTSKYWPYICLTLAGSFCHIIGTYTNSSLQVEKKYVLLSYIKVVPAFIKLLILIILLWFEQFIFFYILIAFLSVPLLTFVFGIIASSKEVFKVKSEFRIEFSEIFKYSKWILISSLTVAAIAQVDILMVRSMVGVDELSILVGGQKLANILPIVTVSLVTVLLPEISRMKQKKELNFYFRKCLLIIPASILLVALGLPAAKYIIPLVLGTKYTNSIIIFQIYFLGFCLGIFLTPLSLIIYNLNKEYIFALINSIQLLINIIGNYFLIPLYGAAGAAAISVAIRVIGLLIILYVLYKHKIFGLVNEEMNENTF